MTTEYIFNSKVWLFPYEKVSPGEEVIIYGAGFVGARLIQQIKKNNYCKIKFVVDRNYDKIRVLNWGGVEVKSPEVINECNCRVIVAIENETVVNSVIKNLIDHGISKDRIVSGIASIPYVSLDAVNKVVSNVRHIDDKEKEDNLEGDYEKLTELLTEYDYSGPFVRVGKKNDGGYIMADHFYDNGKAYSFGISDDCSWDKDMAERGYDVYMFDHTIESINCRDDRLHFYKTGIADSPNHAENLDTLENILRDNECDSNTNMILKMDVEGAEYGFMEMVENDTMKRFDQIVFELHDLHTRSEDAVRFLEKIDKLFAIVHVHVNNHTNVVICENKLYPDVVELTLLNRDNYLIGARCTRNKYLDIDAPNWKDIPDFVYT